MNLVKYLNEHFYTREELVEISGVSELQLADFQKRLLMPLRSYNLSLDISCKSFFGEHSSSGQIEYYSKGYTSWLGILNSMENTENAYNLFEQRYANTVEDLARSGFVSNEGKLNAGLDDHIKEEWKHFLSGTYGLCTKNGLPEDIASKEVAISLINELLDKKLLSKIELVQLAKFVTLLDSSSSDFAPHEYQRSSRYRLIDEVRRKYQLRNT